MSEPGSTGKSRPTGSQVAAASATATDESFIAPGHSLETVTDHISQIVLTRRTPKGWWIGFGLSFLLAMLLIPSIGILLAKGTGVWGLNVPVGWAFAIINFVWWIGIGHAGTLISAILLLLQPGAGARRSTASPRP